MVSIPKNWLKSPLFYVGVVVLALVVMWVFGKLLSVILKVGLTGGVVALALFLIYRSTKAAKTL